MSPVRLAGCAFAGALLGLLGALVNGTSPLGGLTGGLLVGELVALLAPRDDDEGGVAEEATEPLEAPFIPLSTHN